MARRIRKFRLAERRRMRYWHSLRQELMRQKDAGNISQKDFDVAFDTMSSPRKADRVIARSSQELGSVDWVSLVDWMKEHWVDILKMIFSIAMLFLDEQPSDDNEFDGLGNIEPL